MSSRLAVESVGLVALAAAAVRISISVSLAALGESVLERSGIVNVGLEGMMLAGAFSGFAFAAAYESALLGAALGAVTGAFSGLVFGAAVTKGRANPIVMGVALNFLALGSTAILMRRMYPSGTAPLLPQTGTVRVPYLADAPILGPLVFDQSPYFYALLLSSVLLALALKKSRAGLFISAAGERPQALLLAGIRPESVRLRAAVVCGFLAGLGGSQLAVESASTFTEQATAGRGFVALAIVVIAQRKPLIVPAVALIYGAAEAYALRLLTSAGDYLVAPAELLPALPFAITLAVYAIASLSSIRRSSLW